MQCDPRWREKMAGIDPARAYGWDEARKGARVPEEPAMKSLFTAAFLLVSTVWTGGCTTNVENPTVNQQGRGGNITCVTDCDNTKVTCVAKCTDDACKATCESTRVSCEEGCPPPADGG